MTELEDHSAVVAAVKQLRAEMDMLLAEREALNKGLKQMLDEDRERTRRDQFQDIAEQLRLIREDLAGQVILLADQAILLAKLNVKA
jgi:SepF-like predicted cell division protein (DUF552 family)